MKHFSHEHPLELIDEVQRDDDAGDVQLCNGCNKHIISGSAAYTCRDCCNYNLHKKCAELPKQIQHPMHLEHPLTLFSHPPYSSSFRCNVCKATEWKWFTYHCSICEFDVDILCELEDKVIDHEGHHHPLTFVERSALFHCDACGTKEEDVSYRCTTCSFWIHKSCAKLPTTIKLSFDDHPLVLAFFLPTTFRNFEHDCKICRLKVHPSWWVYYCALCRYFVHLKCATVEKEPLRLSGAESAEAYLDPTLMNFPVSDNSVDVISQFVKSMISPEAINDIARELIHFSHDHPLTLFDAQSDNTEMINDQEIRCNGCCKLVTDQVPFYTCSSRECNFYLHQCCAQLPQKIPQHPSHPSHPLSLFMPPYFFIFYKCNCCEKLVNGLFYYCLTCKFYLDVHCACQPRAINHDAHNHSLKLEPQSSDDRCSGCDYSDLGHRYKCGTCDFKLDNYCVTLPRTVKHDWDRHPLILSYPPFSYHPDEFLCEFCEEFINPDYWLYHCRHCDHSFHTTCIKPFDRCSNVKFGGTLQVDNHPHPLVFVRKSKNNKSPSICTKCGKSQDGWPVLECAPCNFQLCPFCCYDIVRSLPST